MARPEYKELKEACAIYTTGLIDCVNRTFTKDHILDIQTKRTLCGLVWKKNKKGQVWVPNAIWFSSYSKCKHCYNHTRVKSQTTPRVKGTVKKVRSESYKRKQRLRNRKKKVKA